MTEGETVRIKDGMIFDVKKPISRSADLMRLRNEGYDLEIRSDHLLVKDVP